MKKVLKSIPEYKLILLLLFLALLLRLPWLYTTMERDEGTFGYTSHELLSGEPLYSEMKDNKPPFLYLLYAIPIKIFGNSIIPIRMFNNLLFFTSIIFFFLLIKKEYGKKNAIYSSVFYIFLMNIPSSEGPLAVSESFMIPFFVTSIYFLSLFLKKTNYFYLGISITLISLASLIRHNALAGLFLIFFLSIKEKKLNRKALTIILFPLILFLFLIIYFLYTNRLSNILKIIFSIHTQIPFSYSLLVILENSFILLLALIGFVSLLKKKEIKKYSLVILWFLFLTPFLFFPRSFHNALTFAPPIAVFAGLGFNQASKTWKKERVFMIITILLLTLSLFLILKQYPNYNFKLGRIQIRYSNFESYGQQMGLANFIKNTTRSEDNVLVMGWEPAVYWLSERHPPIESLAYSLQSPVNMSRLEYTMKKEKLAMVLFLDESEGLDKQFEFLSNKKIVSGIKVYEITLNEDYCYLNILRKRQDKKICELISTPFLKQICLAMASLNLNECYIITNPFFKDGCLAITAVKSRNANLCHMIEDEKLFNFCMSRLNVGFDYAACVDSLKQEYDKIADYQCRRYYAIFMNDTAQCEHIEDYDEQLFCKESVTSDVSYCENIIDRQTYSSCMVDATSDPDYCRGGTL